MQSVNEIFSKALILLNESNPSPMLVICIALFLVGIALVLAIILASKL